MDKCVAVHMSELNENFFFFLILLAIYEVFLEISQNTDLYQSLMILGGTNIEISQTSLCCEAGKLN